MPRRATRYLGTEVGPFLLVALLAEGVDALVFSALDSYGAQAAVKVLPQSRACDRELALRFTHEAEVVRRIAHPHVVRLLQYGELPDGALFYAMELIDGIALDQLLVESGGLERRELLLAVGFQLAGALGAAHDLGIVHRDLKPENVIVSQRETEVHCTLIDFGIAKSGGASWHTAPGAVFGTPHYMAPEQALGMVVDARTDVYALGLVLYALWCGHPPFEGADAFTLLSKQVSESPVPLALLGADAPLSEVVMRCLAKDPEARFANMADLASALESVSRNRHGRSGV